MINELSEGVKISFMDRKESELERKVRKLEQDMIHLDSILNNQKLVRKKSIEYQKPPVSNPTMLTNYRSFHNNAMNMAQGDGPDPWQVIPIHIHRNSTSSQVQPAFFFTWDCTPYDFHNNSAQRSIYTLLDQWEPDGHSMSTDQFKKQLSALLAANKESTSTTDLTDNYHQDLDDIQSSCGTLGPFTSKTESDIKKPDLDANNSDLDIKKSDSDTKNPNLDTKELLANLEKKLKEVEYKCRDDYVKVLNPFTTNKMKTEENVTDTDGNKTEKNDQDNVIIDDLIFEMFKDSEEFGRKPIELAKEVDDLQSLIISYNLQVGDSKSPKLDYKK